MGLKSRTKGNSGEREIARLLADLTGYEVKRRVRQHEGDSDLEGVPGWCIEVKRHAKAPRASVRQWWHQACQQAQERVQWPVLLYRQDRDEWRAVWPLSVLLGAQWDSYEWAADTSIQAWCAVLREQSEQRPHF